LSAFLREGRCCRRSSPLSLRSVTCEFPSRVPDSRSPGAWESKSLAFGIMETGPALDRGSRRSVEWKILHRLFCCNLRWFLMRILCSTSDLLYGKPFTRWPTFLWHSTKYSILKGLFFIARMARPLLIPFYRYSPASRLHTPTPQGGSAGERRWGDFADLMKGRDNGKL